MPLLMINPDRNPLPPEQDILVPGGSVLPILVGKGQLLAITDLDGGQPAGIFAIDANDTGHILSPHHTRVFSNSFLLKLGMRLVTNRRRPAMVLGISPSHLAHDLLMPLTEASIYGETGGADRIRDKVIEAFETKDTRPQKVADPINLFLDVAVGLDGSLKPRGVSSRPGDTVAFRVLIDMVVAVAAPHSDPKLWSRPVPGPIAARVRNNVADLNEFI